MTQNSGADDLEPGSEDDEWRAWCARPWDERRRAEAAGVVPPRRPGMRHCRECGQEIPHTMEARGRLLCFAEECTQRYRRKNERFRAGTAAEEDRRQWIQYRYGHGMDWRGSAN